MVLPEGPGLSRVTSTKGLRCVPHPENRHKYLPVVSSRCFSLLGNLFSVPEVKAWWINPHKKQAHWDQQQQVRCLVNSFYCCWATLLLQMSSLAWDQLTQGFERGPSRCDKVWTAESHVVVLLHARLPSPLHGMLFVTAPPFWCAPISWQLYTGGTDQERFFWCDFVILCLSKSGLIAFSIRLDTSHAEVPISLSMPDWYLISAI